ncbi:MAG: ABC transporter ATP-binding protein [Gammaproteobacteria bacterium]|nr:ABC transporter ATP-binding protein [Gammaproteobacteria bacterium]MCP5424034.1 ABC transporter ATP-binding protein [Gammaproteobacteria bacterium]MCP5459532.1 ABC transporter ATP-binding protein [Gammaproteobacteria bacterium]
MATRAPLIRIRQLRKTYLEGDATRCIFEHLDLDIHPGEFVALLGRSGSGKSTLLNLLSGIDLPDAGEIRVDGQTINTLDEQARTRFRRRRVGFVFQFFNLIPTLTVEENLLLPLELNGMNDAEQRRRATLMLDQVGLGSRRSSYPEQLSGGEQQRLACIRALVHRPLLLLADEPTGNLDDETGAQVLALLLKLHREAASTVLMVTHSREVAEQADRLLYLEASRVREIAR